MAIDPKALHSRILSGDKQAETELAEFVQDLAREDYHKTLGPLAEDYLQDLGIRAVLRVRQNHVEHPQFLVTFCKSIVADVRIDGLRAAARDARRLLPMDRRDFRSERNFESDMILAEQYRTALRLIEQLDPVSKEIIWRFYFEHQPVHKIEREMGLTNAQVRGRKDEAVKKLHAEYRALNQGFRLIRGGKKEGRYQAAA